MKPVNVVILVLCCILLQTTGTNGGGVGRGINGGWYCAGCTFLMGVSEQLSQIYNETLVHSLHRVCNFLPKEIRGACKAVIDMYGPVIIQLVEGHETADVICYAINFCYVEKDKKECSLFPPPKEGIYKHLSKYSFFKNRTTESTFPLPNFCVLPGTWWICKWIENFAHVHLPAFDLDGDGYSKFKTLRGTSWRGKDCSDLYKSMHPGAKPIGSDTEFDSNCNGIYGVDDNGTAYEDKFCRYSGAKGIAILGDSAAAHFHIPAEWVNSSLIAENNFEHLMFFIENEVDWPSMSFATGYENITWPIIHGPVDSLYMRLRERNRCNHRDYQNIGVNGADSFDMLRIQHSLSRQRDKDKPMLAIFCLVGNDVCNGHADTISNMTTPAQMKENVLKTLEFLDTRLAADSHVLLIGLADGGILYNHLHDKVHPLGSYEGNVLYKDLYDYLSCMEITPCNGWLNGNETLRNFTTKRARDLSQTMEDIAISYRYRFRNFEVNYMENPMHPIIAKWIKDHGEERFIDIIEQVDGFHPNQVGHKLIAEYGWNYLQENLPHYIGDVNPFNDQIISIFGDQGGH